MHYLALGLRHTTISFAHVAVATLAIAAPFALAEDVGATGVASLITPSLRHGLQPVGISQPLTLASPLPAGSTASSLIKTGLNDIYNELYATPYQIIPAVCALVIGLVAVFNGEHAFRWLVIISIGVIVGILAKSNTAIAWFGGNLEVREARWEAHIVGVEAGMLAAFVTYMSYEGTMIVTGAIVGVFFAIKLETLLKISCNVILVHLSAIGFYSIFAVFFAVMFWSGFRKLLLALLMPILGGSFVVSALFYMITDLATNGPDALKTSIFSGVPEAVLGKWIEFFNQLWTHPKKDVGLFAGKNIRMMGSACSLDWTICHVFWFIFFVVGARRCVRASEQDNKMETEPKDDKTTPLLERKGTS